MAKEVKAPLGLKSSLNSNSNSNGNKTPTGVTTTSAGTNNSLLGG